MYVCTDAKGRFLAAFKTREAAMSSWRLSCAKHGEVQFLPMDTAGKTEVILPGVTMGYIRSEPVHDSETHL